MLFVVRWFPSSSSSNNDERASGDERRDDGGDRSSGGIHSIIIIGIVRPGEGDLKSDTLLLLDGLLSVFYRFLSLHQQQATNIHPDRAFLPAANNMPKILV